METCHVCGEALDGENQATCFTCRRPFHLPWRVDVEVNLCGRVWMDPDSLGLGFTCHTCAQQAEAQAPPWPPFPQYDERGTP